MESIEKRMRKAEWGQLKRERMREKKQEREWGQLKRENEEG